jgi:hypothetical protein
MRRLLTCGLNFKAMRLERQPEVNARPTPNPSVKGTSRKRVAPYVER